MTRPTAPSRASSPPAPKTAPPTAATGDGGAARIPARPGAAVRRVRDVIPLPTARGATPRTRPPRPALHRAPAERSEPLVSTEPTARPPRTGHQRRRSARPHRHPHRPPTADPGDSPTGLLTAGTRRQAARSPQGELFARIAASQHPTSAADAQPTAPMSTPTSTLSTCSRPIIDAALTAALRTLKLSGMLQTLDARLAQARAGELGHLDFLQVLCHDEISRRETIAIAPAHPPRPVRAAPSPWKASTSPPPRNCPPRRSATSPPCAGSTPASRSILYGPVGVGKTHVAQALGHLAIRHGAEVRFPKTSRALADLAGGHADRTWDPPAPRTHPPRRARSSTTSPCASSPPPRPTTSTNSSPNEPAAR